MPIVQTPTWLNPRGESPAESYARGFQLGEQRRQANQRAALEQQQMMIQAAARSQEQAQRTAAAQAELAQEIKKQEEAAAIAQEELAIKKQAQANKDRAAAMQTAGIVALQNDLNAGIPTEQAIARNFQAFAHDPGAMAGALHAIRTLTPPPAFQPSTTTVQHPITGEDIPVFQSGRGSAQMIKPPPAAKPAPVSRAESAELDILKREILSKKSSLEKDKENLSFMPAESKSYKGMKESVDRQQSEIDKLMGQLTGKSKPAAAAPAAGASKAKQRMELANRLMSEHPDWTKEQIITEARKQIP